MDVVAAAVDAVGGRYMMIECKEEMKLVDFYSQNDFTEIARIPDEFQPMVHMIRKIGRIAILIFYYEVFKQIV